MIKKFFSQVSNRFREFLPKSIICLQEGYGRKTFFHDLFAGISVGVIAIPLSLAFAIASGVAPEKGLFTAVIAGFLISLLGGSRIQIGGPAGAFVIVVYGIVQKYGYEGLAVATLIAAFLMILMGILRLGILLKFVPYPVTTGFTSGIAVVIFSSQIKDFFGLKIADVPTGFIEKWMVLLQNISSFSVCASLVAIGTLFLIFFLKHYFPKSPAVMLSMGLATLISFLCNFPLETIGSKFGGIPSALPSPHWPSFSWELIPKLFPSALTIAFLGAIESLLSAAVADGMTGNRHKSNCELVAQGFANIGSIFFGGMPATGVIARTTANIKMGAKTPIAGMIHAVTVLAFMLLFSPFVAKVPLATLSAVLIFVAWNMSEIPHFVEILKGQKGDGIVLLITFFLTILIDLSVAVQVGVVLAAIVFLKRMTDKTTLSLYKILADENRDETDSQTESSLIFRKDLPKEVAIFEINGPFFYSVSNLLDETLIQLNPKPRVFILSLEKMPLIDATGIRAIRQFETKCQANHIVFLLSGVKEEHLRLLKKRNSDENVFLSVDSALIYARNRIQSSQDREQNFILTNEVS